MGMRINLKWFYRIIKLLPLVLILGGFLIWIGPKIISIFDTSLAGQLIAKASKGPADLLNTCLGCLPHQTENPEIELAVSYLRSAVYFDPGNPQAYYLQSKVYFILGDPIFAEKAIQEFIHLRPQNPLGHISYAVIKSTQCDDTVAQSSSDPALNMLDQICPDPLIKNQVLDELRIGGVKGVDLLQTATQLKNQSRLSDSLHEFTWALVLDPDSAQAWYGLGTTYQALKNWQYAIFAYTQSNKIDPGDVQPYYRLGEIMYSQQNRLADAYQVYERLLNISPGEINAYILMGNIDEKLNRNDEALRLYTIAVEKSHTAFESAQNENTKSDYFNSLSSLAEYFMRQGKYSDARPLFEEVIQIASTNEQKGNAYWNLGRVDLQSNNFIEAKSNFNLAYSLALNSYLRSQVLYGLAQADIGLGSMDEGIEELEKAHVVDPSNEGLQRIYADTLRQNGQPARALEVYQDYLTKWPNNQEVIRAVEELRKSLNGK